MGRAIAIDMGGGSGRVLSIMLESGKLSFKEIHRFPNRIAECADGLHWDLPYLMDGIREGLEKAGLRDGDSISVDTWGVDYVLTDSGGTPLHGPFCYRDGRTEGMPEKIDGIISRKELYQRTGIVSWDINTLYQLLTEKSTGTVMFIPDWILSRLSGKMSTELSIASTSQLVDAGTKEWDRDLRKLLGLDRFSWLPVGPSGRILGPMAGHDGVSVISGCGHDTASALAAVPAEEEPFLFISSGTWSLIGTELDHPVLNEKARLSGLSNETGYGKRTACLKNISGLWIIQCLSKEWGIGYGELEELAGEASPFRAFIDPDDPVFSAPGPMEERIRKHLSDTGQDNGLSKGETVRTVYESLALKYREARDSIEEAAGTAFTKVHIIGGGSRSMLLSSFTASSLGIPAVLGPAEATAIGNGIVQFLARKDIGSLAEARKLVAAMPEIKEVRPGDREPWDRASSEWKEIFR